MEQNTEKQIQSIRKVNPFFGGDQMRLENVLLNYALDGIRPNGEKSCHVYESRRKPIFDAFIQKSVARAEKPAFFYKKNMDGVHTFGINRGGLKIYVTASTAKSGHDLIWHVIELLEGDSAAMGASGMVLIPMGKNWVKAQFVITETQLQMFDEVEE